MNKSQKPAVRRHPDLVYLLSKMDESGYTDKQIADGSEINFNTIYWGRTRKVHCAHHTTMAKVAGFLGLQWRLVKANI